MNTRPIEANLSLDDRLWERIAALLPKAARTGRPRANDRRTVVAILHVLATEIRWCDLPREMGSYVTAWRRYRDWSESGVWARVWRAYCQGMEAERRDALERRVAQNPRARQTGVLEGREIWVEPEALEAAIDALVEGYNMDGGIAAVMLSNEGLDMSWGL
jgi:transposase